MEQIICIVTMDSDLGLLIVPAIKQELIIFLSSDLQRDEREVPQTDFVSGNIILSLLLVIEGLIKTLTKLFVH